METKDRYGKSFALRAEQFLPLSSSFVVFLILVYYADVVSDRFIDDGWNSAGLYSAIFGWAAIQTGFSFGVYGFIIGKKDGFVNEIRDTRAFQRFVAYIQRSNYIGFALTFASIPLIVIEPDISQPLSWSYVIVCSWFSLFVWSFLSFCRLAFNFGRIVSVKDKEFHGA